MHIQRMQGRHISGYIRDKSNDVKSLKEDIIVNCDFLAAFDRGFCLFVTPLQRKQNPNQ